ncbi:MAG: hypothetical protein M1819_001287 [Sarea resinae]|nr:MAG: hypothetical protein M1819_001287 [Sarea resinae]
MDNKTLAKNKFYRWEDTAALDHKCGTCEAHKCDACRKSAELHDKRHREITDLIAEVHKLDEEEEESFVGTSRKKGKGKARAMPFRPEQVADAGAEADDAAPDAGDAEGEEQDQEVNAPAGPAGIRASKSSKVKKLSKKEKKAAKNLAKAKGRPKVITGLDVDHVGKMIHFDDHPAEQQVGAGQANLDSVEAILARLGVQQSSSGSKQRKGLAEKLSQAIRGDLDVVDNENRETMMRMAGYWRYVNKKTYNHMVENNTIWDWHTGARLARVEEEEDAEE